MKNKYVLDACALIAFIYDEIGADVVQTILEDADKGNAQMYMNKLNLFEVYYNIMRLEGYESSENFYSAVLKLPIEIISDITDEIFKESGKIKSKYKISLADSIALGTTVVLEAKILTSDHHEFDMVEKQEKIQFQWIR